MTTGTPLRQDHTCPACGRDYSGHVAIDGLLECTSDDCPGASPSTDTTTRLTNERKYELMEAYGFTDEQIKQVMRARGFKDLNDGMVLEECCANMGYIWSFRLERWFDKNPVGLQDDQEDFDALLDEVRKEDERE